MSFLPHSWVLCWVSWIRLAHFLWDLWQGQISWGDKEGDVSCFLAISRVPWQFIMINQGFLQITPQPTKNPASCISGRSVTTNIPQSCTTWTANSIIIFILFMNTLFKVLAINLSLLQHWPKLFTDQYLYCYKARASDSYWVFLHMVYINQKIL